MDPEMHFFPRPLPGPGEMLFLPGPGEMLFDFGILRFAAGKVEEAEFYPVKSVR